MTEDHFEPTRAALAPLWRLTPPGPKDLYRHPAFVAFKDFCEQTFPAADRGMGFPFGLADALRGAGLPCLMSGPAVPGSLDEGARWIAGTFEATSVRRRYLCPLDLADTLPEMKFGPASVRDCSAEELARLFDGARLARHFPAQPLDARRLAEFRCLIIEEQAPVPARAGQWAMPFLYENWSRDFGAIDPHAGNHPGAVTDALFAPLLAPWEDWHSLETDWRGFLVPWIHIATDDLFVRPHPVPTADTLSWEDAAHQGYRGEMIEYERPVRVDLDDEAVAVLAGFDDGWWSRIETAMTTSLFETPIEHFLVRAAFSEGMDQIMAHMTTVEAALGLRSDFNQRGRPKGAPMSPSDRVAKRVEALLGDPQAGSDYGDLFETRSAFVHGRSIQGLVASKDRNLARQLARRVTVALIDAANGPARQAPALMEAPGVSTGTVADMLVVLGDNPQRIRSEAAFAKLCGVCPVPASSGKTSRHRLNRGGNRRANAALYRVALVRMRHHPPTREYIQRRTAEGKLPREIRRCLKRYIAREIYRHLCADKPPVTACHKGS